MQCIFLIDLLIYCVLVSAIHLHQAAIGSIPQPGVEPMSPAMEV